MQSKCDLVGLTLQPYSAYLQLAVAAILMLADNVHKFGAKLINRPSAETCNQAGLLDSKVVCKTPVSGNLLAKRNLVQPEIILKVAECAQIRELLATMRALPAQVTLGPKTECPFALGASKLELLRQLRHKPNIVQVREKPCVRKSA